MMGRRTCAVRRGGSVGIHGGGGGGAVMVVVQQRKRGRSWRERGREGKFGVGGGGRRRREEEEEEERRYVVTRGVAARERAAVGVAVSPSAVTVCGATRREKLSRSEVRAVQRNDHERGSAATAAAATTSTSTSSSATSTTSTTAEASQPEVVDVHANGANGATPYAANGVNGAGENGRVVLGEYTESSSSSSNGSSNGNGAAPASVARGSASARDTETSQDGRRGGASASQEAGGASTDTLAVNACDAGQLSTCAVTRDDSTDEDGAAEQTENRWSRLKSVSSLRRSLEIWGFVLQFIFRYVSTNLKFTYGKLGMTKEAVSERRRSLAIWLREGLVKLGPTFIKIGQQFSTRVDVLSPEFVKELEKLQDNVPPFSSAMAVNMIRSELGRPVDEVFDDFQTEPIAAASLGQVHRATYKGKDVVVKVQRPGLRELFAVDLKNIRAIASLLQSVDPKTDGAARDWVAIYDECSRILYQEIDYRMEAQNAERFRNNFGEFKWLKVPDIYEEVSAEKVLTMEYVPGVKINRGEAIEELGLSRTRLARLSVESYLLQLLKFGFFHADPHPGNIAVDNKSDDTEGKERLIIYDFGMMGSIPGDVRGGLSALFYGVYQNNPDACLTALVDMGVLVPGGDVTALRRTARFFLDSFRTRLSDQRKTREEMGAEYNKSFKAQRTKDESKAKRKEILASIGEDLLVVGRDQPFRFPAEFTFVVRAFTVLDGIGKSLDARFDISEISRPYARQLLLEGKPALKRAQRNVELAAQRQGRAIVNLFRGPDNIDDVANTMRRLESGDLKLRVRALEAERALERVSAMQDFTSMAIISSAFVNIGTVLSVSALATGATISFWCAGLFGMVGMVNYLKVSKLAKKEKQLLGL